MILHIKVVEAKDLPKMDVIGASDPYVKIAYSKSQGSYQTRYIKQTLTPVWNEEFHIAILDKAEGNIHFAVLDWDQVSEDDLISTRDFPINSFKVGKVVDEWYDFYKSEKAPKPGKIHIIFHLALPTQLPFSEDRSLNSSVAFCKLKAESLTPEVIQGFKDKFEQIDENKDGSITLTETRAFFDKIGINPVFAPIAFVLANKDANSSIALSEFEPFYKYLGDIEQDQTKVYRMLFQKFDHDNSGFLDQKECLDLVYFFGGNDWNERNALRFIQTHDDDKDGKLSFDELCYLLDDVLSNTKDLVIKDKQGRNNTLESQLNETLLLISEMKNESIQLHQKLELAEQKLKSLLQNH